MRSTWKQISMILSVAGLLGPAAVYADELRSAKAQVPFAFTVQGVLMPAGQYRIARMEHGIVRVTNTAARSSIMISSMAPIGGAVPETKLVFRCYAGRCFLSQLWYAGDPQGYGLTPNRLERELAATKKVAGIDIAMR